jgi:hypothetical protein
MKKKDFSLNLGVLSELMRAFHVRGETRQGSLPLSKA